MNYIDRFDGWFDVKDEIIDRFKWLDEETVSRLRRNLDRTALFKDEITSRYNENPNQKANRQNNNLRRRTYEK